MPWPSRRFFPPPEIDERGNENERKKDRKRNNRKRIKEREIGYNGRK
jgi:hypothetical protein